MALRTLSRFGLQQLEWNEYRERADHLACGLIGLSVSFGERIAILAENSLEWLVTDQAIWSAGAVSVPLHTSLSAEQVAWQLRHSSASWCVVSSQAQLQKVLEFHEELPELNGLILIEEPFQQEQEEETFKRISWNALLEQGRAKQKESQPELAAREQQLTPKSLATIIYTSGTTGDPKGVMLSHGNLVSNAINRQAVAKYTADDIKLSWLPYSHAYARTVDCLMSAYVGMTVILARNPKTLREDLKLARPTWMTGVPRFYEKIWRELKGSSSEQRTKQLHEIFGDRIRCVSCGGAAINPEIVDWFWESGLPLLQGYGLTETSPVMTLNTFEANRTGTVGRAIPGVEIKITEDGEVLTRGPQVMQGYWNNPEATSEVLKAGWFHTGDAGELDAEGYLSITGRKKELIVTSQGKNIAPIPLEQLLASDEAIQQAVVEGEGRPFLSAVLVPDFEYFQKTLGAIPPVEEDFWNESEVLELLTERIDRLMSSVSTPEKIRRFLVLTGPFTVERQELTPSLKVRRTRILQKYAPNLEELYEKSAL